MTLQNCRIAKSEEKYLFLAGYCLLKDILRSYKVMQFAEIIIFSKALPEKSYLHIKLFYYM